jgi:two-component system cell cycle response regulator
MSERILVVDDEQINRELLDAILTDAGYTVLLAEDGPAALKIVAAERPDLILLDLLMPGIDGLEVCRRLKAGPAGEWAPIIVVTAVGQVTAKERLLSSGADDFITKPIQPDDLRMRVRAMLKVRGIRQDLDRTLAYLQELEAIGDNQRDGGAGPPSAERHAENGDTGSANLVLLVDDEPLSRELYSELLTEHGFLVEAASSGRDGLTRATERPVDAVLLDIVMPEMSGLAVLEHLQAQQPDLPVIVLTSHPTSQNAIAALKLGAFDFLVKGHDQDLVVLAVHRALRHRREARRRRLEGERTQSRIRALEARLSTMAK